MKKTLLLGFLSCLTLVAVSQNQPKPPMMALSTWNAYRAKINEKLIRSQADALVEKGLADAGYKFLNIDDGFFAGRDEAGNIRIDNRKFPNGMKAIADYIHSKGLKAGMYGDAGPNTCASIWENPPEKGGIGAGFYNNEEKDMELFFKTWGFDYLKVDYCGASQQKLKLDEETQYTKIKNAIVATGVKDFSYNVCRWEFPGTWVTKIADSWRISPDINPTFGRMVEILDMNTFLAPFMSPGHYNDMDMLEIGNGKLSFDENNAQMSLWSVLTSPLVIGCDLNKISKQTLEILKNNEVIAVNQDMTEQGHLISDFGNPLQVWSKKLNGKQSGERAVVLFNRTNQAQTVLVRFADIDLKENATIRDLWTKTDLGSFTNSYSTKVPAHGVVMVKISGTNIAPTTFEAEYAYLHNFNHLVNTVAIPNQARAVKLTSASKAAIVSYIGGNADNYIEFRDISVEKSGKYQIYVFYRSPNTREATIRVNGKAMKPMLFDPKNPETVNNLIVNLKLKKGNNTIRFENAEEYMPDLDKIILGNRL